MIKQRKRVERPSNSDQSVHTSVLAECMNKLKVFSSQLSTMNNFISVDVDRWVHRSQGYKTYFMLNSTVHYSSTAHNSYKTKMLKKIKIFLNFRPSEVALIMLINVKMSTIVGILVFMSMINFMLS